MNEHDRYEEPRKDDHADEAITSVPPAPRDTAANEHDEATEDGVQTWETSSPNDTPAIEGQDEETGSEGPPAEPAKGANEEAASEIPDAQPTHDEAAAGDQATSNNTDVEATKSEDGEAQAEDAHRCPRMVLRAGTDEQSLRALELCREKVKQLRLKMRPLAARFEGEKHVTIYFRADDKVDFRKLVRELSRLLHARIELRQVGPREQGKLCGLLGKCGYPLCCQTFLGTMAQSTIKMAKTQELALNPMKISGVCGRLLCCLNYEQEMYTAAKSRMPKVNRMVETEFGPGKVIGVNVLKDTVTVQLETMIRELRPDQVHLPGNHE